MQNWQWVSSLISKTAPLCQLSSHCMQYSWRVIIRGNETNQPERREDSSYCLYNERIAPEHDNHGNPFGGKREPVLSDYETRLTISSFDQKEEDPEKRKAKHQPQEDLRHANVSFCGSDSFLDVLQSPTVSSIPRPTEPSSWHWKFRQKQRFSLSFPHQRMVFLRKDVLRNYILSLNEWEREWSSGIIIIVRLAFLQQHHQN